MVPLGLLVDLAGSQYNVLLCFNLMHLVDSCFQTSALPLQVLSDASHICQLKNKDSNECYGDEVYPTLRPEVLTM